MMNLCKAWGVLCLALISVASSPLQCTCSPYSCLLSNVNAAFFENVESFCSELRNTAQDISIINVTDAQLSPVAFAKFPSMVSLDVIQGKLTEITKGTFKEAKSLSKLLIKGNNVSRLVDYAFDGADELKELIITGCHLTVVSEAAFANLKHLDVLMLTHGQLTSLPKRIFRTNRELTNIALKGNKLPFVDPESFIGLEELANLDLSFNQLTTFDSTFSKASYVTLQNNSLRHLTITEHCKEINANNNLIRAITVQGTKLTKLELTNNQITDISNITKLVNLTNLYLGNNPLLPNTVFSSLVALDKLILPSTYINVTPGTFANLTSLRILDLSYNNLTELDFSVFRSQPVLELLILIGNNIQRLDYVAARRYLPQLIVMDIHKNGWNSTYFESNVARMKALKISPNINDFRGGNANAFSEKLIGDSDSDEYSLPADDESDIKSPIDSISSPVSKPSTVEASASPLHTWLQILFYILLVVGSSSLVVLMYLWKNGLLGAQRRNAPIESVQYVRLQTISESIRTA